MLLFRKYRQRVVLFSSRDGAMKRPLQLVPVIRGKKSHDLIIVPMVNKQRLLSCTQ